MKLDADDAYDEAVQSLMDARADGRRAGKLQLAASLCPFFPFEPEYNAWQEGRLSALIETLNRRIYGRADGPSIPGEHGRNAGRE